MANQKISELNSIALGALNDEDVFTLVDTSAQETKKIEWSSLKIPPFIGARVSMAVNTTGVDYTSGTELSWDSVLTNVGTFFNTSSAETFHIPPEFGGKYFDVSAYLHLQNVAIGAGEGRLFIRHYNAAGVEQEQSGLQHVNSQYTGLHHQTHMLMAQMNSGDYVNVWYDRLSDASVDVTTRSFFRIRVIGQ